MVVAEQCKWSLSGPVPTLEQNRGEGGPVGTGAGTGAGTCTGAPPNQIVVCILNRPPACYAVCISPSTQTTKVVRREPPVI